MIKNFCDKCKHEVKPFKNVIEIKIKQIKYEKCEMIIVEKNKKIELCDKCYKKLMKNYELFFK